MRHIRDPDASQHTVIMIQVENESGSVGSVRDYSPAADKQFAGDVPALLHTPGGTWSKVYGADADERFAAYYTAHYINEVAKAVKEEYSLPMYCNVWLTYPVHALENLDYASPGQEYPSGGAQQGNIAIWKAAAPSIDMLAPDFYSSDTEFFHQVVAAYHRDDNPLFIPRPACRKTSAATSSTLLATAPSAFRPSAWTTPTGRSPKARCPRISWRTSLSSTDVF